MLVGKLWPVSFSTARVEGTQQWVKEGCLSCLTKLCALFDKLGQIVDKKVGFWIGWASHALHRPIICYCEHDPPLWVRPAKVSRDIITGDAC